MIMFDIKEFKSYVAKTGYTPKNRYYVNIWPPRAILNSSINVKNTAGKLTNITEHLQFRAESVTIPGVSIIPTPVSRYGISPQQRFGVMAQLSDISMTFTVDRERLVWMFFYHWINNIFSFNQIVPNGNDSQYDSYSYRASYMEDYATKLSVFIYDYSGSADLATTVEIYDAFPVSIEPIGVGWSDNDSIMKITVKFSYRDWAITDTNTNDRAMTAPAPIPLTLDVISALTRQQAQTLGITLPSDIRLKKNISELKTMSNGIKLYKFEYLWSDVTHVGVMAQDIMKIKPEAVVKSNTGYYGVNYDMLGLKMSKYEDWIRQTL